MLCTCATHTAALAPRPPHRRLPQALQSRNQILEGLNVELQAQLSSKEREVEKLKVALDVAAERSLSSTPSSPRCARCGVGPPTPPHPTPPHPSLWARASCC